MTNNNILNLSKLNLPELKRAYDEACRDEVKSFVFEGHELLTDYAKYLIIYAEKELKQ